MNRFNKLSKISRRLSHVLQGFQNSRTGISRGLSTDKPAIILGIETSCDETSIAAVDTAGNILGESTNSQLVFHLHDGGINPINAIELHKEHINRVYEECLQSANLKLEDVDAIATTVEPGLASSLKIGKDFGINLSRIANKPLIPIHHMKAHALVSRLFEQVDYPFLTLLISGGHSLIALAESHDSFKLLGHTLDNAVGEVFDKTARRLKLMNILEYSEICGGAAIELCARKADDPNMFPFVASLAHYRDCNFSFSGIATIVRGHIIKEEEDYNIRGSDIIPHVNNLCAGYLLAISRHICHRIERAILFIDQKNLIPDDKRTLVVSGGVASNDFIFNALTSVCKQYDFRVVRPPRKYCTDNGVMIAWNGVERYKANLGVLRDLREMEKVNVSPRTPIGEDWIKLVTDANIKLRWTKLNFSELVN